MRGRPSGGAVIRWVVVGAGVALAPAAAPGVAFSAPPGPESAPSETRPVGPPPESVPASAAAAESSPALPDDGGEDKKDKKGKKDKKDKSAFGEIEVHGRAILRAELRSEDSDPTMEGLEPTTLDLSLASARIEARYALGDWLRLQVEVEGELAGGFSVKDAFVRLKHGMFGGRFGHFKMPVSVIEMEGIWTLPIARRDVVHDVLSDSMGVVGRRPGLQGELNMGGFLDLEVDLGVFQGSDELGRLFDEESLNTPLVAGRVSISPAGVKIGAFGEWRPSQEVPAMPDGIRRYWAAGVDVSWTPELAGHAVRIWADAIAGNSWFDTDLSDELEKPLFMSGRVIAAWRFGGLETAKLYFEPYALFAAVDPDSKIVDDVIWEVAAGVNVGAWDRLRVTLEVEHRSASRNTPLLLFIADREALLLQIGGRF